MLGITSFVSRAVCLIASQVPTWKCEKILVSFGVLGQCSDTFRFNMGWVVWSTQEDIGRAQCMQ